jgi:hypothetical protein
LADALGDQAAVSKPTVSAICQQIKDKYEAWAARRLDGVKLNYLFLDASFFRMHPGSRPSRCWPPGASPPGITTEGRFGVAVLGLNAIDMMFFIRAYPFWALVIIAVDVVALWGVCAYGNRANLAA